MGSVGVVCSRPQALPPRGQRRGAARSGRRKGQRVAAPTGTTAAEFVAQIAQNGDRLIAYGYFTRITGVAPPELFDGVPGEANARYTAYAEGDLVITRAMNGPVTVLDVVGTLRVFRRATPGANSANPDSFRVGRIIARFDLTLQDVLAGIAPNTGLPTLSGDMRQTSRLQRSATAAPDSDCPRRASARAPRRPRPSHC